MFGAGLVPLFELAEQAGLTALLDQHVRFTPVDAQAAAALRVMQALCPDGDAEIRLYDEITFIDQGENFQHVRCPRCATALEDT